MFPESYSVVFIVSIAHPNYFSPLFFLFQDPFVIKIHPKRGPSHPDLSRFPLHIISNPVAFLICPLGVSLEFALFARSGLRLCGVVIVILEARNRRLTTEPDHLRHCLRSDRLANPSPILLGRNNQTSPRSDDPKVDAQLPHYQLL